MPAHPELSGPWPTVERLSSADYPSDGPPGAMLNLARAANREDRRELRDRALAAATNDPHLAFQVQAEEAVDAAARNDLQRARQLADAVLEAAADAISVARATEALGRAELWSGTHSGRVRGIRLMEEAIGLFRELGSREWAGWGLTWLGYAGYYLAGELAQAVDHMRRGLDLIEQPLEGQRAARRVVPNGREVHAPSAPGIKGRQRAGQPRRGGRFRCGSRGHGRGFQRQSPSAAPKNSFHSGLRRARSRTTLST